MTTTRVQSKTKKKIRYCDECGIKLKSRLNCHVNFFWRSPKKRYIGSGKPFIHTENLTLCEACLKEIIKKILKICNK